HDLAAQVAHAPDAHDLHVDVLALHRRDPPDRALLHHALAEHPVDARRHLRPRRHRHRERIDVAEPTQPQRHHPCPCPCPCPCPISLHARSTRSIIASLLLPRPSPLTLPSFSSTPTVIA